MGTLAQQRASVVAFEVQADDLGEGAFVGLAVEADGQQVEQLDEALAVAQAVGALADELLRKLGSCGLRRARGVRPAVAVGGPLASSAESRRNCWPSAGVLDDMKPRALPLAVVLLGAFVPNAAATMTKVAANGERLTTREVT